MCVYVLSTLVAINLNCFPIPSVSQYVLCSGNLRVFTERRHHYLNAAWPFRGRSSGTHSMVQKNETNDVSEEHAARSSNTQYQKKKIVWRTVVESWCHSQSGRGWLLQPAVVRSFRSCLILTTCCCAHCRAPQCLLSRTGVYQTVWPSVCVNVLPNQALCCFQSSAVVLLGHCRRASLHSHTSPPSPCHRGTSGAMIFRQLFDLESCT